MASHKLVYDVTYQLGDSISAWQCRLRLITQSVPFWKAGAVSNDSNLTTNNGAKVEIDSVGDVQCEIDANNQPGLRQIANRAWVMYDTVNHDFRTNVIIPLINAGANSLRLVCKFDCDFGTGTFYRTFTGVVDMQQYEHDNLFYSAGTSQEDYRMNFTAIDFTQECLTQSSMTKAIDGTDGMIPLLLGSHRASYYASIFSTTVTTGANSATQTLGSTKGMFVGELLAFPESPFYFYIISINSGTSVTLSGVVNTTTGDNVYCDFYMPIAQVYRSSSPWNINKFASGGGSLGFWLTSFNSTPNSDNNSTLFGQFPDSNWASLASVLKMFCVFIACCAEGGTAFATTEVSYDFTGDHFQLNAATPAYSGSLPITPSAFNTVGQGTSVNVLTRIILNAHTHLENWSWNTAKFPNFGLQYREYNLDAAYAFDNTQYLNNGTNIGGNCPSLSDSLKKLLGSFFLYANFSFTYDGSNEVVNLRVTSPLSPTIKQFLPTAPPILLEQYASFPGFIPAGSSSASMIKPPPFGSTYLLDMPYSAPVSGGEGQQVSYADDTQVDQWNPTYTDFFRQASGAINMTLIAGTFYDDFCENQIVFLYDLVNHPYEAQCADSATTLHMPANAYPFLYAASVSVFFSAAIPSNFSYANPIAFCQTWGGGKLNGSSVQTANVPTFQHGMALGGYSLYCGGIYGTTTIGAEKINFLTAITSGMTGISDCVMKSFPQIGFDANTYNYLILGYSFNEWKITGENIRTVKFTGIRSMGY